MKMTTLQTTKTIPFKARPSTGWLSLVLIAAGLIALAILAAFTALLNPISAFAVAAICGLAAAGCLLLALFFPTMRYELHDSELSLHYGSVIHYRIPYKNIRTVWTADLGMTIMSSFRFPGIALFKVPYNDIGEVKMCSSSALHKILIIEAAGEKYGITPANEKEFLAALHEKMGR
jgi:hypothetical protein